jgi:hypothetical protein
MIAVLKMAEVSAESVPQLATQWAAVCFFREGITIFQIISIMTSTVTICSTVISRITLGRREEFISDKFSTWASLAPLFLFLIVGVFAGTTQFTFVTGGCHD